MAIIKNKLLHRLFALAMIPVMGLVFHNYHANWHYHGLSNGLVIKHAHPVPDRTDAANHTHSKSEFFRLEQLYQAISSTLVALVLALILFFLSNRVISKPPVANVSNGHNLFSNIRGPPRLLSVRLIKHS